MLGFHGTDEEYRHENRIMRDETDRRLKRLGDIRRLYKPEKEDHEAAMPKPPAVPESLLESEVTPLTFHQREKDRRKILKEQEEFEVDIRELRHADLYVNLRSTILPSTSFNTHESRYNINDECCSFKPSCGLMTLFKYWF